MAEDARMEDSRAERDVLVLSKTVGSSDFPVERPAVIGVDRETGDLVRLTPFPWKGADTDPPIQRWTWINVRTAPAPRDPRSGTIEVAGEVAATGYVEAKDGWRLRWPFVRPHLVPSVEILIEQARASGRTLGFVRPAPDADVLQLPLRLRFRCDDPACATHHELPVLDWELHEMARATRERAGPQWATRFRETWGAPLFARFDVHVLISTYAQAAGRVHVAGLYYPPRDPEDAHAHAHHVEHKAHLRGSESAS